MDILKYLMYGLHALVGIALILLVVSQTSKHEGLGAVGGASAPAMRGRQGVEEKLSEYTKWTAGAFMILSVLLYLMASKFGWV